MGRINNNYYYYNYLITIIPIMLFINKRASYSDYFELCGSQQKR